jgi:hypothetical protein
MNKKIVAISVLTLMLCAMAASVFAETFVCNDPSETVNVSFYGSTVLASYTGKSAQSFQVIVALKDGSLKTVTFSFSRASTEQTRVQTQSAGGEIEGIANCSLKSY